MCMMSPLEELWYGNLSPQEQFLEGNTEYIKLLKAMGDKRDFLENLLSAGQKQALAEYDNSTADLMTLSEAEAFKCGFTLGSLMMIEVLK